MNNIQFWTSKIHPAAFLFVSGVHILLCKSFPITNWVQISSLYRLKIKVNLYHFLDNQNGKFIWPLNTRLFTPGQFEYELVLRVTANVERKWFSCNKLAGERGLSCPGPVTCGLGTEIESSTMWSQRQLSTFTDSNTPLRDLNTCLLNHIIVMNWNLPAFVLAIV